MKYEKIPPFDYLKGNDFTEKLKEVTGCKTFLEMADLLDVQKAIFSTWKTHDRTSHELMVRLHLRLGVPIEDLALSDEDREEYRKRHPKNFAVNENPVAYLQQASTNPQHQTVILKSYCLSNGGLIPTGEVPYAYRRLNSYGLLQSQVDEIETNEAVYLVDKGATNALSGKYLIDIDGLFSINQIQRLPGKKLAVVFGDSTMEVSEEDIKVIGRVAVTLQKQ